MTPIKLACRRAYLGIAVLASSAPAADRYDGYPRPTLSQGLRPSYTITADPGVSEPEHSPKGKVGSQDVRASHYESARSAEPTIRRTSSTVVRRTPVRTTSSEPVRTSSSASVRTTSSDRPVESKSHMFRRRTATAPPEYVMDEYVEAPMEPQIVEEKRASDGQALEPVETLDGYGQNYWPSEGDCETCGEHVDEPGHICDIPFGDYGCDREPCPCPTDEVLGYYRCNFYGHYPTFWRPWPDNWLKFRPEVKETMYDRFRKPTAEAVPPLPGMGVAPVPGAGVGPTPQPSSNQMDLDRQLQELLRSQSAQPTQPGVNPGAAPGRSTPPPLIPDEDLPPQPRTPKNSTAPKAGSNAPPTLELEDMPAPKAKQQSSIWRRTPERVSSTSTTIRR